MHEILRNLPPGARVLDLGCREGSFALSAYPELHVIRLDREPAPGVVQADAARLPFRDHAFDAIISNHSLEHMEDLDAVLREIGRVIQPAGALYVAVPDASTFSDRLYQWIYHGGGHVNAFRDARELAGRITRFTALPLTATRTLHASFLYLARHHFHPRPPRRMWLFANGDELAILALSYIARILGFSKYGWAFWFGTIRETVDTSEWKNVCIRCGTACPAELLNAESLKVDGPWYRCPQCGTRNLFTRG